MKTIIDEVREKSKHFSDDWIINKVTALKSTDKCKQQKLHQDFEVVYEDHGKIPAVALVAIQENTAIMIGNKREEIPKAFMLLMRGDMSSLDRAI